VNLTAALMELEETVIQTEVKVTELCEPTGDVMYKYIYDINVITLHITCHLADAFIQSDLQ